MAEEVNEQFWRLMEGDTLAKLKELPAKSVDCIITSPPYWQIRDYGFKGQYGLEPTIGLYTANMVKVFEECRRVLKTRGVMWLNMGDCYSERGGKPSNHNLGNNACRSYLKAKGFKRKELIGQPWRLAFALSDAGWYLRLDVVWNKPNAMPESARDRPSRSHEYIFLLSKSAKYLFDKDAIKEKVTGNAHSRGEGINPKAQKQVTGWDLEPGRHGSRHRGKSGGPNSRIHVTRDVAQRPPQARQNESMSAALSGLVDYRSCRSVWDIATKGTSEDHYATFPEELARRCILSGCPLGGVVLDPFIGSGTTMKVALELGRSCIGIDLDPKCIQMSTAKAQNVNLPLIHF